MNQMQNQIDLAKERVFSEGVHNATQQDIFLVALSYQTDRLESAINRIGPTVVDEVNETLVAFENRQVASYQLEKTEKKWGRGLKISLASVVAIFVAAVASVIEYLKGSH